MKRYIFEDGYSVETEMNSRELKKTEKEHGKLKGVKTNKGFIPVFDVERKRGEKNG